MSVDEALGVRGAFVQAEAEDATRQFLVPALFSLTAFVGAGLLFVVQPLVARIILPSYGGSATVWSTSSLFFQSLLLVAYLYAHLSTRRLGHRWQPRLHLLVLTAPLLALPLTVPGDAAPAADVSPVLWLLRTLTLVIGLPFAVVATTGPLLQRWYSWTDAYRSEDPYFLFAASNLGSFGGLLAYPLLVEPNLTIAAQRAWWSVGFLGFLTMTAVCALLAQRSVSTTAKTEVEVVRGAITRPGRRRVTRWIALAFLPSSLMLGVTSHISTDVAAIPLLWVVPLAIYLATFVLAFARTTRKVPLGVTRAAVASSFAVVVSSVTAGVMPVPAVVGVTMLMLALVSYAAHARLAADRPEPELLTTYYLVIAAGGALGGVLNGLVAPVAFDRVLEFPLALSAVPLLLVGVTSLRESWVTRHLAANRVRAALVVVLIALVPLTFRVALWLGPRDLPVVLAILALAAGAGWLVSGAPRALMLGLVLLFTLSMVGASGGVLEQTRSFFGAYTVRAQGGVHQLVHGTTIHGTQFVDSRSGQPTTYYAAQGPLGDAFREVRHTRVAAIGLGAGTIAAYGEAGETITFFEIDPEMVRIASDARLFTYLSDSDADVRTVVGDGRLRVAESRTGAYDLLVLDAFSSDAIPVHLLTEEAMEVYADRLDTDGVLLAHISNRVFDLEPVLAGAARHLGWAAAIGRSSDTDAGATPSAWVAMSRDEDAIDALMTEHGWTPLGDRVVRWTDDYSSILSVLR